VTIRRVIDIEVTVEMLLPTAQMQAERAPRLPQPGFQQNLQIVLTSQRGWRSFWRILHQ
jgi:hypothetical protein